MFAVDYGVEHAVFEKEFGALKSLREFLADGLFDHAGAGKADKRAGFGYVQVSEHGEGGGSAAGGGVGEYGDVGDAGRVEAGEGGGNFSELDQAGGGFHPPAAPPARHHHL